MPPASNSLTIEIIGASQIAFDSRNVKSLNICTKTPDWWKKEQVRLQERYDDTLMSTCEGYRSSLGTWVGLRGSTLETKSAPHLVRIQKSKIDSPDYEMMTGPGKRKRHKRTNQQKNTTIDADGLIHNSTSLSEKVESR